MNKLVVTIMGQNCEKFLPMCLESVKNADAIVYCDGGSNDDTFRIFNEKHLDKDYPENMCIIENEYSQKDPQMNGKQRNFYLDYLKKNYPGWFALCLDADEVVEDLDKIKEWINDNGIILKETYPAISIKMRHLYNTLGEEDATSPKHFILNRLFYVCDDLWYPEVEHPVLQCKDKKQIENYNCEPTTIWHLAFAGSLFEIKKRFDGEMKKAGTEYSFHTEESLKNIYYARFLGTYPTSKVNFMDIPSVILDYFNIDRKFLLKNIRNSYLEELSKIDNLIGEYNA